MSRFRKKELTKVEPFKTDDTNSTENNDKKELTANEKKRKNLIKAMLNARRNEAVQGVLKMALADSRIIQIFWLVCLIIATGLCAYLILASLFSYLQYGVFTTSRTIVETPTTFPKITICNYNQFATKYAFEFLNDINQKYYPQTNIFDSNQMANYTALEKRSLISKVYKHATAQVLSNNFTDEDRKKLGHNLEDILFSCLFNNQPCSTDDFLWKYDRYYGNCFVFNSGFNSTGHKVDLKKSAIAGQGFGLQLQYYINTYENLSLSNSFYGTGGYLKIENASYLIDDTLDGIFLKPAESPDILVYRSFKKYLPKPYSNCDIDNESPSSFGSKLYNTIANSPYEYKQQLCFIQCLQQKSIEICSCTNPWFNSLLDGSKCRTDVELNCTNNIFSDEYISSYVPTECPKYCPLECNTTEFRISYSSAELFGDLCVDFINENPNLSEDFVNRPINMETAKRSFAYFFVAYDSLTYSYSSESPSMDAVALLANLGGTLGLFMGISALTICEIFEIFFELYIIKATKNVDDLL